MDRDFKGVWIPAEIWLDKRLNALDKMIMTEVDSLDIGNEGCYASNQYIAEFCQCSQTKVSASVSKLCELGYLSVEGFNGRIRKLKSCLTKSVRQDNRKSEADLQNLQDINIENKQKNISIRFSKPTLAEVESYCRERKNNVDAQRFVDYYESNGWKVGKNPMRDWKAAVRTWERNASQKAEKPGYRAQKHNGDLSDLQKEAVRRIMEGTV